MSYWISEIYREFDDRTSGIRNLFCHVFADDVASMPTNDSDRVFTIGSVCDVVANGSKYMINSSGNWILQPSSGGGGGDTYTREEIDDFLAAKQNLLTWAAETAKDGTDAMTSGAIWNSVWNQILGVNTTKNLSQDVPETGYDCDTLTDIGIYRVPSAAVAADIANIPIQAAGRLIVSNLGLGNRYIQIYLVSGARVFIRSYISIGWQAWYEYQGGENMTDYPWGNYMVSETTGNVSPSSYRLGSQDYFSVSGDSIITYSAWISMYALQTFYLFYDSSQTYLGSTLGTGYIGWVDCGVPVKVPSQARYYRISFRRQDGNDITPDEMIKCIRQTG